MTGCGAAVGARSDVGEITPTKQGMREARTDVSPNASPDRFGRSGGIRTHDPQSPRLMRYQAALRSDRGDAWCNSPCG
jgi:hypothetical protein